MHKAPAASEVKALLGDSARMQRCRRDVGRGVGGVLGENRPKWALARLPKECGFRRGNLWGGSLICVLEKSMRLQRGGGVRGPHWGQLGSIRNALCPPPYVSSLLSGSRQGNKQQRQVPPMCAHQERVILDLDICLK